MITSVIKPSWCYTETNFIERLVPPPIVGAILCTQGPLAESSLVDIVKRWALTFQHMLGTNVPRGEPERDAEGQKWSGWAAEINFVRFYIRACKESEFFELSPNLRLRQIHALLLLYVSSRLDNDCIGTAQVVLLRLFLSRMKIRSSFSLQPFWRSFFFCQ